MMVKESVLVYTLECIIAKGNVSFYICLSVCQCMMVKESVLVYTLECMMDHSIYILVYVGV